MSRGPVDANGHDRVHRAFFRLGACEARLAMMADDVNRALAALVEGDALLAQAILNRVGIVHAATPLPSLDAVPAPEPTHV